MNIEGNEKENLAIARVEHMSFINPVAIKDEPVIRVSGSSFRLEHKNILIRHGNNEYDFSLRREDGLGMPDFTLDIATGEIKIDNDESINSAIYASYVYDGVDMWDYDLKENGKTYFGPEAKDISSPGIPPEVKMIPEYDKNRIRIIWGESDVEGKLFYYRVQAFESEDLYSSLSEYRSARLLEDLADRPYLVEKSIDGIKWREIARVSTKEYIDFLIDTNPPMPIRNLSVEATKRNVDTKVNLTIKWGELALAVPAQSSLYRVRAVNKLGYTSEASAAVGPVPFDTPIKEIVIRMKERDGNIPTFAGEDAVTIGVVSKEESTHHTIVEGGKEYTISVYVVDLGGNYSIPTTVDIIAPDNTKPIVPTILSATEFSMIIG